MDPSVFSTYGEVGSANPSQRHPATGLRFMAGYGPRFQEQTKTKTENPLKPNRTIKQF